MNKGKLLLTAVVVLYILNVIFDMYYVTSAIALFYYGKHVLILLVSIIILAINFKNLKNNLIAIPKEIHFLASLFLLKTVINLFRLAEPKMLIYVIQDVSIIFFIYAVLMIADKGNFILIQRVVFRTTSILLLLTFIFSLLNGVELFEVWARWRFIFGFDHPGYLGSIIAVSLMASAPILFNKEYRKPLDIFLQISMLIFLLLNYSRNAILVVLIYIGLLLIFKYKKQINIKFIYTFMLSLTSVILLVSILFFEFINTLSSLRLSIWVNFIKDTLFQGGNFLFGNGFWVNENADILSRMHVDNYYLEFIYESGFLLFVLFFIVLNLIFIYLAKAKGTFIKYSLSSFLGIVAYGFFDSSFLTFGSIISVYLWFNILYGLEINFDNKERS
jgi:O-antigen ligase